MGDVVTSPKYGIIVLDPRVKPKGDGGEESRPAVYLGRHACVCEDPLSPVINPDNKKNEDKYYLFYKSLKVFIDFILAFKVMMILRIQAVIATIFFLAAIWVKCSYLRLIWG